MNAQRRKQIAALVADLRVKLEEVTNIQGALSDIGDQIEALKDEEQEYFDNMPESFQQGDKGSAAEQAVSHLDNANDDCVNAQNELGEAMGSIQNTIDTLEEVE